MRQDWPLRSIALVVAGGTFGTLSRFGVSEGVGTDSLFPLATFLVNIAGSFALGALLAALPLHDGPDRRLDVRLLVGTGFLGGFTTYSALAVEADSLLRGEHVTLGVAYAVGTVVAGLLAALAGVAAVRAARA